MYLVSQIGISESLTLKPTSTQSVSSALCANNASISASDGAPSIITSILFGATIAGSSPTSSPTNERKKLLTTFNIGSLSSFALVEVVSLIMVCVIFSLISAMFALAVSIFVCSTSNLNRQLHLSFPSPCSKVVVTTVTNRSGALLGVNSLELCLFRCPRVLLLLIKFVTKLVKRKVSAPEWGKIIDAILLCSGIIQ
ncbi:Uncharacterised protein [Klebsiella pneumoniae]|nr:Uncharacterised protein [Klebsiella pneumoniae]